MLILVLQQEGYMLKDYSGIRKLINIFVCNKNIIFVSEKIRESVIWDEAYFEKIIYNW